MNEVSRCRCSAALIWRFNPYLYSVVGLIRRTAATLRTSSGRSSGGYVSAIARCSSSGASVHDEHLVGTYLAGTRFERAPPAAKRPCHAASWGFRLVVHRESRSHTLKGFLTVAYPRPGGSPVRPRSSALWRTQAPARWIAGSV